MIGPDLIRLAEELADAGGIHRLTSLVTAAVHVCLEHERRRPRTVEAWETGPCGLGMSDKAGAWSDPPHWSQRGAAARPPASDGVSEGISGRVENDHSLTGSVAGLDAKSVKPICETIANPHPLMPERGGRISLRTGNALTEEACDSPVSSKAGCVSDRAACETQGGIVHLPGSKVAAEFGPSDPATRRAPKPVNPEITDGDGA